MPEVKVTQKEIDRAKQVADKMNIPYPLALQGVMIRESAKVKRGGNKRFTRAKKRVL